MSGKYAKKKNNRGLVIAVILALLAAAVAAVVLLSDELGIGGEFESISVTLPTEAQTQPATEEVTEEPTEAPTELPKPEGIDLGQGLVITDVSSYSGPFVEDGSDEQVSDVLMIVVYNYGVEPVQYAEIAMAAGDETASFTLTTLPVGERMTVLESGRMAYDAGLEYTQAEAVSVAHFLSPMSLCQDKLMVQGLDGVLNIMNVSDEDITGEVAVYYKNGSEDLLCGGITYRVRIAEGLQSGEIRQIVSDHFSASGSRLMFVTCG